MKIEKLIEFLKLLREEGKDVNYCLSYHNYTITGLTMLGCATIDSILDEYKKEVGD